MAEIVNASDVVGDERRQRIEALRAASLDNRFVESSHRGEALRVVEMRVRIAGVGLQRSLELLRRAGEIVFVIQPGNRRCQQRLRRGSIELHGFQRGFARRRERDLRTQADTEDVSAGQSGARGRKARVEFDRLLVGVNRSARSRARRHQTRSTGRADRFRRPRTEPVGGGPIGRDPAMTA